MKIKLKGSLIILALTTSALIISCTKERDEIRVVSDCSIINAKFSTDINTIILTNCAINSGCHGVASINGPGPLTNYSQVSGAATLIKDAVVSRRMPLGGALSEADINRIRCWVESGAPNN